MSDDYGYVKFYWMKEDTKTGKEVKVEYPTPKNLKDTASSLIDTLNQKSKTGNASLAYAVNYLTKFRATLVDAKITIPDSARIFIENNDASLDANVNDFESFILLAGNIAYVSKNAKSDEVKDSEMPIIQVENSENSGS